MRTAIAVNRTPLLRAALLGSGLAAAWVVVSLAAGPSSASAEEDPKGVLGTVGSVVGTVGGTVDTVVDEVVDPVVTSVTAPVTTTVEAVQPVAPAPAQPVVEAVPVVVDTVTDAASGAVDDVDAVASETVAEVAGTVGDVAGSSPVGSLVDTLDTTVGLLPIVGPVLDDAPLDGLLGPVAGGVDDALGTVVGRFGPLPDGGVLPSLPDLGIAPGSTEAVVPLPVETGGAVLVVAESSVGAQSGAPPGDDSATPAAALTSDSGPPGTAPPLGALAPAPGLAGGAADAPLGAGTPAGGSTSGSAGSGGIAGSDAASAAHDLDAMASLVLHAVDDALPSSPIYDTDTTPD
ncbi:hypothetical protein AVP42_00392 [Agromyces sp. NDB4Y10]|uniref:hypothetical protein n=1 Tax=Agromyces sp. NDB4Y10 TaxID=1775951 RepID=UPI0007B30FC0|nr:hypothetical protein [Agromyces sp. NDB4Y10]KZE95279.1 hypothetical protein AVP42_00392 [Agromyces sp. NDB4Y10]